MSESLFEIIKTEELYHIYQTHSTKINKELLNKFKEFPIVTDFFKHYTNIDIDLLDENINSFFIQISSIADISSLNTFESSAEQYINDFSQLYIVLNAICKINDSIEKIVTKINASLSKLYEKHSLNKEYQKKINEITKYMLSTNVNKGNLSTNSTSDNSENSIEHKIRVNKLLNFEKIELLKDLLKRDLKNQRDKDKNNLNASQTDKNDLIHVKSDTCLAKEKSTENNERNSSPQLITVETIDSKLNEEKLNDKKNNENLDDNILSNDINEYITSVPRGSFLTRIKHNKKRSIYQSCKNLTSETFRDAEVKNFQLREDEKLPFYESSEKLIVNEDSKMYADLLEIIYELYQKDKITSEQKLKLKKLIIIKCPKILSVYKKFQNLDSEKLTEELKELV